MKRPHINEYPIVVDGKHQYYHDDIMKYIDYLEAQTSQRVIEELEKQVDEYFKQPTEIDLSKRLKDRIKQLKQ